MSNLTKGLVLIAVLLGIGAGLVVWKSKVAGHSESGALNKISKAEIELLLGNAGKQNPMLLKRLAENPELKKQQLDNIKQLLALATEAQKLGITNEPDIKQELKNIRSEIMATSYDREINKDKGPMPPFGFVTEDQVKAYWAGGQGEKTWWTNFKDKIGLGTPDPETEFQKFLDTKIKLLKEGNPQMKDREISEEEKTQAKDFFAKVQIYAAEAKTEMAKGRDTEDERKRWKEFQDTTELQVKLQQAQFLAQLASKKIAEKMKVTDEEIAKYIADHPELDTSAKKAKAQEILGRAKGGEDFAKLAQEFSEDPGSKEKGGLYENVEKGKMVAPFEAAALALEPGQISPELVETDFGWHIIKLEKKGQGKDAAGNPSETYDARHILISSNVQDPENPGRPQPVKEMVRAKLEGEREKTTLEDIVKNNHVEVPEDFDVPPVSDEDLQKMMQKQQGPVPMGPGGPEGPGGPGGPQGAPKPGAKPEMKKPEPKKK